MIKIVKDVGMANIVLSQHRADVPEQKTNANITGEVLNLHRSHPSNNW